MILEGETLSINPPRALSLAAEKRLATRSKVEMDGVAAAWLLFQFSRQSKEQKASHTIRTILPNGDLKVVNIEVECLMTKKTTDGKAHPAGLPGAFAQDMFIALMDLLVNQIKSTHGELIARAQTIGLKGVSLPPGCTEVYFRNKDLAQTMQISEKNARITEALEHLHRTHIRIRGCIYRNGKEESVTHDTYYIPALTAGKRLRGGMERTEWQRAKFDDVLVREILHGYIAQMDTDKLLKLPSGAPRKLYSLLAAKILERRGEKTVVITNDEIINTLRIKKTVYRKLAKRYFQDLIDAHIVSEYSFAEHKGVDVVVFTIPPDEHTKALISPSTIAADFFAMAEEVAKKDNSLKDVLANPRACDLDKNNLATLLRQYSGEILFDGKLYPKVLLWADMLLYNRSKGQGIKSVLGLLKSLLKKDEEPTVAAGFKPIDSRFKKVQASTEAKRSVEKAQEITLIEDQRVQETAQKAWRTYSTAQREKITQAIQDVLCQDTGELPWQPQPNFFEFRAIEVIMSAINHGMPTSEVNSLVKWYKEQNQIGE